MKPSWDVSGYEHYDILEPTADADRYAKRDPTKQELSEKALPNTPVGHLDSAPKLLEAK
jgi:hypothetical protein